MRKYLGWRVRVPLAMVVAAVALTVVVTDGGAKTAGKAHAAAGLACGLGNGQKATGTPILLGAIAVKQAGTDFTDIPNMANAYFQCVNANGGIYGHPIQQDLLDRPDRSVAARGGCQAADPDRPRGRDRG